MGKNQVITLTKQIVTLKANQAQTWPSFAGSKLRGAFGHALKQAACITQAATCDHCPVLKSCAYGEVFESVPINQLNLPNKVHPSYKNRPPAITFRASQTSTALAAGDSFDFGVTLIGDVSCFLPSLLNAWQQAAQKLSKSEGALVLGSVKTVSSKVLNLSADDLPSAAVDSIEIEFESPFRVQHNGKLIKNPQELSASTVLMSAVQRVAQIIETRVGVSSEFMQFRALSEIAARCVATSELTWSDLKRYSNRQKRSIPLGGLVGTIRITGDLTPFMPYLKLAQELQIGKETTFGLGRFSLVTTS